MPQVRTLIYSRFSKTPVKQALAKHDIRIVTSKPDLVLCFGGDGTLLLAEGKYPCVPKLLVRRSAVGNKAHNISLSRLAKFLLQHKSGNWPMTKEMKLIAKTKNSKTKLPIALNDITLRNASPLHALRFSVKINGKQVAKNAIGDGVVIATPFGSSGYYHAITRDTFSKGIGIAFNNSTILMHPLLVDDDATIELILERGDAIIASDNLKAMRLKEGSTLTVKRANNVANIINP